MRDNREVYNKNRCNYDGKITIEEMLENNK